MFLDLQMVLRPTVHNEIHLPHWCLESAGFWKSWWTRQLQLEIWFPATTLNLLWEPQFVIAIHFFNLIIRSLIKLAQDIDFPLPVVFLVRPCSWIINNVNQTVWSDSNWTLMQCYKDRFFSCICHKRECTCVFIRTFWLPNSNKHTLEMEKDEGGSDGSQWVYDDKRFLTIKHNATTWD